MPADLLSSKELRERLPIDGRRDARRHRRRTPHARRTRSRTTPRLARPDPRRSVRTSRTRPGHPAQSLDGHPQDARRSKTDDGASLFPVYIGLLWSQFRQGLMNYDWAWDTFIHQVLPDFDDYKTGAAAPDKVPGGCGKYEKRGYEGEKSSATGSSRSTRSICRTSRGEGDPCRDRQGGDEAPRAEASRSSRA